MNQPPVKMYLGIFIGLLLVIFINLAFLDYMYFYGNKTTVMMENMVSSNKILQEDIAGNVSSPSGGMLISENGNPPRTGEAEFIATASAYDLRLEKLEKILSVKTSPAVSYHETYIPLGSGSVTASQWTDAVGTEIYFAPGNYPNLRGIYFEAGLSTPNRTGRMYVRLYNVTDNLGWVESEIFREGGDPGMVSSGRLPIPASTKLLRVQLKSTLGETVSLNNARLKIFSD